MRQRFSSPTITIAAAVLTIVSAASAHPRAPAIAGRANGSLAYSPRDRMSWLMSAKLRRPAGFDSAAPSASLDGKFPWIPAGVFEGLDAFKYKAFDPQTGQYGVYAGGDVPTLTRLIDSATSASRSPG